jgi:hypothetical protein
MINFDAIHKKPINSYAHTTGFTRMLNVIQQCDRIGSSYKLLEMILNVHNTNVSKNISNPYSVRMHKIMLRKALGYCTEKTIQDQANTLVQLGLLEKYRKENGEDGNFIFTLSEKPYESPYILLSEAEYYFLEVYQPEERRDIGKVFKVLKDASKLLEGQYVQLLYQARTQEETDRVLADYIDALRQKVEAEGIVLDGKRKSCSKERIILEGKQKSCAKKGSDLGIKESSEEAKKAFLEFIKGSNSDEYE